MHLLFKISKTKGYYDNRFTVTSLFESEEIKALTINNADLSDRLYRIRSVSSPDISGFSLFLSGFQGNNAIRGIRGLLRGFQVMHKKIYKINAPTIQSTYH